MFMVGYYSQSICIIMYHCSYRVLLFDTNLASVLQKYLERKLVDWFRLNACLSTPQITKRTRIWISEGILQHNLPHKYDKLSFFQDTVSNILSYCHFPTPTPNFSSHATKPIDSHSQQYHSQFIPMLEPFNQLRIHWRLIFGNIIGCSALWVSNIYLKITIEKQWRTQNFCFQNLIYRGAPTHADIIDRCCFQLSLHFQCMGGDKRTHNHWFHVAQVQKIGILQKTTSEDWYLWWE